MAAGTTLPGTPSKWFSSNAAITGILLVTGAIAGSFLVHYALPYFRFDPKQYDYFWPHRYRLIVHISGGSWHSFAARCSSGQDCGKRRCDFTGGPGGFTLGEWRWE